MNLRTRLSQSQESPLTIGQYPSRNRFKRSKRSGLVRTFAKSRWFYMLKGAIKSLTYPLY